MRTHATHPYAHLLKYEIREIVEVTQKLKAIEPSLQFINENIGDPIAKGWTVPPFVKQIITEEIARAGDAVFGYSHSRGLPETRKWVVQYAKRFSPSSTLDYEDVLFTSGLGASISSLYQMLPEKWRIIQPTPAYPTHTSFESFSSKQPPITYDLDPANNWEPNLTDLEEKIKANPDVAGILVINPNNPTGAVYSQETIDRIIKLAETYQLMVISDEVYFRMVYNGRTFSQITQRAVNRIPLIVMRGLSKDVPWPGGRCGWIEFHNTNIDPDFKNFADSVKQRILLEVCSTTLPQKVLPRIYEHPDFDAWNIAYNAELEKNGNGIADALNATPGLFANRTNGAFYMMPLFKEGVLKPTQSLPIANPQLRAFIEQAVSQPNFPLDKRFTYYLLAATGICVVPASGFYSTHPGFRLTTLDRDDTRRAHTYATLSKAVETYLNS